ncbi:unnamed protein product [Mycena citricolor]|uniref:Uncharacterized protein n=1 Tax=Mycena citricolor TaxID=2018698 RepID=A0AAD2HRC8_9AGAR|nr:unnamed protein product [Mycena citricolor]
MFTSVVSLMMEGFDINVPSHLPVPQTSSTRAFQKVSRVESDLGAPGRSLLWNESPQTRTRDQTETKAPARTGPSILEWTSVQEHLSKLAASNGIVELEDIERYRPKTHAPLDRIIVQEDTKGTPAASSQLAYEVQYHELVTKLTASFKVAQLRRFLKLYGATSFAGRSKQEMAMRIIEDHWQWPSLSAVLQRQQDSQPSVKTVPLTPPQAFLILGRDGTQARHLSSRYHANIVFKANPLSLQIEGTVGALRSLEQHIVDFKAGIVEDIFELPQEQTVDADSLQRISRLSGVLAEAFGENKVIITPGTLSWDAIKAFVCRFVCPPALRIPSLSRERNGYSFDLSARLANSSTKPARVFCHLPPSIASSSSLPASTQFPRSYGIYPFFSPRALPWAVGSRGVFRLRRVESSINPQGKEEVSKTGGLASDRGSLLDLETAGHVLLTTESPGIFPPLTGQIKIPEVLDWLKTHPESPCIFSPNVPSNLLGAQSEQFLMSHRLVYHALDNDATAPIKILKLAVELPQKDDNFVLKYFVQAGETVDIDVALPDRPMDIRFSILNSALLGRQKTPDVLTEYVKELESFLAFEDPDATQPEAPLTLDYNGNRYLLHSNVSVRRGIAPSHNATESVPAFIENCLDAVTDERTTSCLVICDDMSSPAQWTSFMQHCDSYSLNHKIAKRNNH